MPWWSTERILSHTWMAGLHVSCAFHMIVDTYDTATIWHVPNVERGAEQQNGSHWVFSICLVFYVFSMFFFGGDTRSTMRVSMLAGGYPLTRTTIQDSLSQIFLSPRFFAQQQTRPTLQCFTDHLAQWMGMAFFNRCACIGRHSRTRRLTRWQASQRIRTLKNC